MQLIRLLVIVVHAAAVAAASPAGAQVAAAPSGPLDSSRLLAGALTRTGLLLLGQEPLLRPNIEGALVVFRQAAALQPQDAELWRMLRGAAQLAERDDIRRQAVERLTRLDPGDELNRLMRLNDALDRYQNVEQRIEACQTLLQPGNRVQLGAAVASRLAMDLALLHQRRGDAESFAHWLSQAVTIDPSNRGAMALAAGYFRIHVNDPEAEAELLISLLLADPTSDVTQAALGRLFLEHGAYDAAVRLYRMAIATRKGNLQLVSSDLMADLAIAHWGRGDPVAALRTIDERQKEMDQWLRAHAQARHPEAMTAQLLQVRSPIDATLSTTRAAILVAAGDLRSGDAVLAALSTYGTLVEAELKQTQRTPDGAAVLRWLLEAAWVGAWLSTDTEGLKTLLEQVERHHPLSDAARSRFAGWSAINRGLYPEAIQTLGPLADNDPAALLGLGVAEFLNGDRSDGAEKMLRIARAMPGTVMGVWSATMVGRLVGQPVPPSPLAVRLNRLAATIPVYVDRLPSDSRQAMRLTVRPLKKVYNPFEPLLVEIELTNISPLTLAIDSVGPIRPQVAIVPVANIARLPTIGELRPVIVDIDRKLRLLPQEKVTVVVDLRWHQVADALNTSPISGGSIELRATSNFVVSARGAVRATVLGVQATAPSFRVEGVRATREWAEETVASLQAPDSSPDLVGMAMLGYIVGAGLDRRASAQDLELMNMSLVALSEAYSRLDPQAQAWLLSILPIGLGTEPLVAIARRSEHRDVLLSYLIHRLRGLEDPMLDAIRRRDDPVLNEMVVFVEKMGALQRARPGAGSPPPARN